MHTIKHSSIVNKTFFEPGTFHKSPEHPIFAGKTVFLEFLELYFISIHEILHRCKMEISKMWRSPIFEKHFFPAENAGNIPEKPVLGHFLKILPLVFSDFLLKDAY